MMLQVDLVDFSGPDYKGVDKRCVALRLVEKGLCDAALFSPSGKQQHALVGFVWSNPLIVRNLFVVRSTPTKAGSVVVYSSSPLLSFCSLFLSHVRCTDAAISWETVLLLCSASSDLLFFDCTIQTSDGLPSLPVLLPIVLPSLFLDTFSGLNCCSLTSCPKGMPSTRSHQIELCFSQSGSWREMFREACAVPGTVLAVCHSSFPAARFHAVYVGSPNFCQ